LAVTLRSHLLILSLATLLPMVALAAFLAAALIERERGTFRQGAMHWARSLMTAVDAELRGSIGTLQALAASRELERGDLKGFHREALGVLRSQPNWRNVHLASPDGQQLASALRPFGAELPRIPSMQSVEETLENRQPAVGDLVIGPVTGTWDVAVRVPVVLAGEIRYVLSAIVDPDSFAALFAQQKIPAGWVVVLLDRQRRIIARLPPLEAGLMAPPEFAQALGRAPEGWYSGRNLDGAEIHAPYVTSSLSGWTLGTPVPRAVLDAAARRTAWWLAAGVLGALLLATALALWLSRRIARPMSSLAAAARNIHGAQADMPQPAARVAEVREIAMALGEAASAVRENQAAQARVQGELSDANRAKDEFLAMLSHELRNPLAPILMGAQLLKLKEKEGFVADTAVMIERQARQMSRLIEDLLNISGITLGKVALAREPVDLGRMVARLIDEWRASGRLARHRVNAESGSVWVEGDAARLEQVVANLLDNSLKYTPAGGEIAVRTSRDDGHAVVEVRDTGRGFSAQLAGRLFDVFVQGHQSVHRPEGGMGVGLALVQRLVTLHGGTVSASSPGAHRGALFTLRLPAIADPEEAPAHAAPERRASAPSRRILVVEDNEDARRMLCLALRDAGHEVHEAGDGVSAIGAAAALEPEIALIDIGLPGMDGYEVARALHDRRVGRRPVLVALTGYAQPEDKRRAREAGFEIHITKPIDHARLEKLIAEAGRRGRAPV
jgi:signal transduction histidine kinase/ActR/RegA family two-component response regulator